MKQAPTKKAAKRGRPPKSKIIVDEAKAKVIDESSRKAEQLK